MTPIDKPKPLGLWWPNRDKSGVGAFYPSGLHGLDKMIKGVWSHSLTLIGGPPSHGKTVMGVQWGLQVASLGHSAGLLSLEMPYWALEGRSLSRATDTAMDDIVDPGARQGPSLARKLASEAARLRKLSFFVDDAAIDSSARLYDVLVKWAEWGIKVAVLDFLQQVGGNENPVSRVNDAAKAAKDAAKKTGIAVIAMSSLNRQATNRLDTTPRTADLRESGSLEFVADQVFMLHYPNAKDANFDRRVADLYVLKNRNGSTGVVPLWFNRSRFSFEDREERTEIHK